jgi:hypothetical protein
MASRFLRILVITWLAVVSHLSIASDAYFDHVKDLYLHESNQARNPTQVTRYSDGERGQLLRSVLEPKRVKASLDAYVEFQKRDQKVPEVPKILQPIMGRYGEAFKQDPRGYENEYLDSLEAAVEIMGGAKRALALANKISAR